LKLSQYSQPDIIEGENITGKLITRRIRIYPNKEQRQLFKKCFGAHRYFYNQTVECMNKGIFAFDKIRKECIPRNSELTEDNEWMKEIPLDTREYGARKALDAFKTSNELKKKGHITQFKLHFLSRKKPRQVFYVDKRAFSDGCIFKKKLGDKSKIRRKKDKEYMYSEGTFPIIKEHGMYFMCISIKPIAEEIELSHNICALDPGVRTFLTSYSEKEIIEYGYGLTGKLHKLNNHINSLNSKLSKKIKDKLQYRLRRKRSKLRIKAKNVVRDLHWQSANYLTKTNDVVLLPEFKTKQMVIKKKRKIGKETAKTMLDYSHYTFKQRLIGKAKTRKCQVIITNEHYTTKYCSRCGKLNEVGGAIIYKCSRCKLITGRDWNASKNILIRGLTKLNRAMIQIPTVRTREGITAVEIARSNT
jgi:putative transposase